jgi:general secretion pathway protein D
MKTTPLAAVVALVLAGCAANDTFREGRAMVEAGFVDEGLARVEEALRADPYDPEIRSFYLRNRAVALQRYLLLGDNARGGGALDQAEAAYQGALRLDPQNARAKAGVEAVARERRTAGAVAELEALFKKGDAEAAYARAKLILSENPTQRQARAVVRKVEEDRASASEGFSPQLASALKTPITIELREAPVRAVFELISKRTGLNFVFDRDVPADVRTTVFVRDTPIDEVMRFALVTNQLARRVLNANTILIYPNTPQKAQIHRELVVRSFYLDNADAKQTASMVRSLVKTRDLYVDEKLNLLVIRDTPEAVRVVEKLVANQDLADAEVMLEVEVLEVGYTLLQQLGIQWPSSLAVGVVGAAAVPGQLTGTEARHLNSGLLRVTVSDPLIAISLRELAGHTNVLANPRIRVRNKEKARIHIGDRVPVITTTAGATGFVSESVNYLDVGLKLEVEPQVNLQDDVGIRVGLEVSTISSQVKSAAGTLAYQVGTRNTATSLRLRDGETQVLAGLINDEDRRSSTQVPGLAQLPVVGRLFQSRNDTSNKTEIVLLITPRVVRNIERPGASLEQFSSGTELEVGGGGGAAPGTFQPAQITPPPPASQPQGSQPLPAVPGGAPSSILPPPRTPTQ